MKEEVRFSEPQYASTAYMDKELQLRAIIRCNGNNEEVIN
jgi:hypothetical protein